MVEHRNASTLTDLHNSADSAELEVVSLLSDQLPKYKLRALHPSGAASFVPAPVLEESVDTDLPSELLGESLRYFVLCSDRVSQMTKTYNDIEAVTRLLEEKERDLELAARIGQTLLQRNQEVTSRNEKIEVQVADLSEQVEQLKHELSLKDNLLHVYEQDELGSRPDTPTTDKGAAATAAALDKLQRKVSSLEQENAALKLEAYRLSSEAKDLEQKEEQLAEECVRQISESRQTRAQLEAQLARRDAECGTQQQQAATLLSEVADLQTRLKQLTLENCELGKHLEAAQESQAQLSVELAELRERHAEVLELLHEQNGELQTHRQRRLRPVSSGQSLASELQAQLRGGANRQQRQHTNRVFETARSARKTANRVRHYSPLSQSGYSSQLSDTESLLDSRLGSESNSQVTSAAASVAAVPSAGSGLTSRASGASGGYAGDAESVASFGLPGSPGSVDLERVVNRLSLRQEQRNVQGWLQSEEESAVTPRAAGSPARSMTSDTSDVSCMLPGPPAVRHYWPDKLRIVKPIEGSVLLRHWQRLATPHLGGLLEHRPGVQVKDDPTESEREEDGCEEDDAPDWPARRQHGTDTTNTMTMSGVLHPNDVETAGDVTPTESRGEHGSVGAGSERSWAEASRPGKGKEAGDMLSSLTSTVTRVFGLASFVPSLRPSPAKPAPSPASTQSLPLKPEALAAKPPASPGLSALSSLLHDQQTAPPGKRVVLARR